MTGKMAGGHVNKLNNSGAATIPCGSPA